MKVIYWSSYNAHYDYVIIKSRNVIAWRVKSKNVRKINKLMWFIWNIIMEFECDLIKIKRSID